MAKRTTQAEKDRTDADLIVGQLAYILNGHYYYGFGPDSESVLQAERTGERSIVVKTESCGDFRLLVIPIKK